LYISKKSLVVAVQLDLVPSDCITDTVAALVVILSISISTSAASEAVAERGD